MAGVVVGCPTFTGSVLACFKLAGYFKSEVLLPGRHYINLCALLATVALGKLVCGRLVCWG